MGLLYQTIKPNSQEPANNEILPSLYSVTKQIEPVIKKRNELIAQAWKAQEEAKKASSLGGILKETFFGLPEATKTVTKTVGQYAKSVVTEPKEVFKGVAKTAVLKPIEFAEKTLTGKISGKSVDEILGEPKTEDEKKAREVGEFLGWMVPYSAVAKGTKAGLEALNLAPKVAKYIPAISDTVGFIGTGQILHEEGSRLEQLRNDVITLGVFKAVGKAFSLTKKKIVGTAVDDIVNEYKVFVSGEPMPEVKVNVKIDRKLLGMPDRKLLGMPDRKLLGMPDRTKGEGFTMKETATKQEIQRAKDYADYNKELRKYNTNSTPKQLKKVLVLRQKIRSYLENDIKVVNETIKADTGKTAKEHIVSDITDEKYSSDLLKQATERVSQEKPIIEPTTETIKVPQSQLPVGEGELKVSRLQARLSDNLGKLSKEDIEKLGLTTYNEMKNPIQLNKATNWVEKNGVDEAMKVLSGEKPTPQGLLKNSIFVVMNERAIGDKVLAEKLTTLGATRMGQEIEILKELSPHSPVRYMTELQNRKIEIVGGKEKVAKYVKEKIQQPLNEIFNKPKNNLTKFDIESFVQSIKC